MTIRIVRDGDCSLCVIETQYKRASQTAEHERTDLSPWERLCVCVCVCGVWLKVFVDPDDQY